MDISTVALVPVSSYDQAEVDAAVRTGVELLGGIGAFVKKEEKILKDILEKGSYDRPWVDEFLKKGNCEFH